MVHDPVVDIWARDRYLRHVAAVLRRKKKNINKTNKFAEEFTKTEGSAAGGTEESKADTSVKPNKKGQKRGIIILEETGVKKHEETFWAGA